LPAVHPARLIQTHCRRATISVPKDRFPENIDDLQGFVEGTGMVALRFEPRTFTEVTGHLLALGLDMSGVTIATPTLEDVFMKLTGRSLRE
jgi:ABC-2 type transport system ATP-binding protein